VGRGTQHTYTHSHLGTEQSAEICFVIWGGGIFRCGHVQRPTPFYLLCSALHNHITYVSCRIPARQMFCCFNGHSLAIPGLTITLILLHLLQKMNILLTNSAQIFCEFCKKCAHFFTGIKLLYTVLRPHLYRRE